ncbi:MAG: 50S ribosomal protein L3 [Kiritimatiellae bacterium]|jgi:large subunit ribosomal protein L3|nr:50S ribosomal protein L3 [Kiritimatiellia bacterium]MDD4341520.1 50S ribosomal protein L3 [Kiritimatiellia bacterium]MDY0149117.1 50S ribosomal protein L3 [Kiritimatiellia bacterium]
MQTLIGKKTGMTRVYDDDGVQVAVTVVQVGPCTVVQRKTAATDGYEAVQLGFEEQKESRVTKPQQGHFKKAGAKPQKVVREVRLEADEEAAPGDVLTAKIFEGVQYVDVLGHTKGRGFQGVIRKFKMRGGRASHGGAWTRRAGSTGSIDSANIIKNKTMPGQMGSVDITTQNLRVVKVLADENALLLEGAVAGPAGGIVLVRKAIKKA